MSDQPSTPDASTGQSRPFSQFLLEQRNGGLHADLTEQLQQVVRAVMEHEKGGALTLVITVKPMGNGINLLVSDDIKVKKPEADRPTGLFYGDENGNLSRRDPRQPELPLQGLSSTRKAG